LFVKDERKSTIIILLSTAEKRIFKGQFAIMSNFVLLFFEKKVVLNVLSMTEHEKQ